MHTCIHILPSELVDSQINKGLPPAPEHSDVALQRETVWSWSSGKTVTFSAWGGCSCTSFNPLSHRHFPPPPHLRLWNRANMGNTGRRWKHWYCVSWRPHVAIYCNVPIYPPMTTPKLIYNDSVSQASTVWVVWQSRMKKWTPHTRDTVLPAPRFYLNRIVTFYTLPHYKCPWIRVADKHKMLGNITLHKWRFLLQENCHHILSIRYL